MIVAKVSNLQAIDATTGNITAGCADDGSPCIFQTSEGDNGNRIFELKGYDSVNGTISKRTYIFTSLPSKGILYERDFGDYKGDFIKVGKEYPADALTGYFTFIFEPDHYFYNQYCPGADGTPSGGCPDKSAPIRSRDLCLIREVACDDRWNGFSITFNYKIKRTLDGSESSESTAQLWVTNVNNYAYNLTAPYSINLVTPNTKYLVSKSGPIFIQDYDGDVRMLGIMIRVSGSRASASITYIPLISIANHRVRIIEGEYCIQTGNCVGNILIKAPISEANFLLKNLEVMATYTEGSAKLTIKVWDNENDIQDDDSAWSIFNNPQTSVEIILNLGPLPTSSPTSSNASSNSMIFLSLFIPCFTSILMHFVE